MRGKHLCGLALGAGLAMAAANPAAASIICVNPGGTAGCQASIGAAVTAATSGDTIQVAAGTYAESVTINKPLSLVGVDPKKTIINAAGLSNGVYVDGIDTPHLGRVVVANFTILHANFEGILVTNATDVTIRNNNVIGNNKALVFTAGEGSCAGLPAFETNEGDDCGEGIHLLGADHSVVVGNFVNSNAGGILLSDDTGATHDNQVLDNIVSNNSFDCGITLASHAPATFTGAPKPFGVFNNVVSGNTSTKNGLAVAGGAGAGIFASIPGAAAYGNVIIGNRLTYNGMPGVAMHSHAPNQKLTDNKIIGNSILGNGPDNGDAATAGATGINVFAVSPATGTVISGNNITGEDIDIAIKTTALVAVHDNSVLGINTGIANLGTGIVDATVNWWGCPGGPGTSGCSSASGAKLTVLPALTAP